MISVTFKSVGQPYSEGGVTINALCPIDLAQVPAMNEWVSVEGNVTHDSEGNVLDKMRRFQLTGYVSGVSHHIRQSPIRADAVTFGGGPPVSRDATVWLSSHRPK